MAKLNLSVMNNALINKSDELMDKIEAMKNNNNLSENTIRTQTNLKSHESHNLLIMVSLVRELAKTGLEEIDLPDTVAAWFESTTMLTEVRKKGAIVLNEGDSVFDIMESHPSLSMSKLKDLAEKQGFRLERGIIVK